MQAQVKSTMIVRKRDNASVIEIQGELNAFAEDNLMDALAIALGEGSRAVILNFRDLAFMNSSGIGLLVTMLIRAKRQGARLLACCLNSHYQKIFEMTMLNEVISIFATEEDALASLASTI